MNKIALVILSGITIAVAMVVSAFVIYRPEINTDGLIPVERISGIYAKAELKPGCIVTNGYQFPFDDNGIRCHCIRVSGIFSELTGEENNPGLPVKDISIIDVYGDRCTITFMCTDDNERYAEYDYPLSNLKYNEKKVKAANDNVKVDFVGSRYTLAR